MIKFKRNKLDSKKKRITLENKLLYGRKMRDFLKLYKMKEKWLKLKTCKNIKKNQMHKLKKKN